MTGSLLAVGDIAETHNGELVLLTNSHAPCHFTGVLLRQAPEKGFQLVVSDDVSRLFRSQP